MTRLLHPSIHSPPRRAVSASCIRFTDSDGKSYVGASGGAALAWSARPDRFPPTHPNGPGGLQGGGGFERPEQRYEKTRRFAAGCYLFGSALSAARSS